MQEIGSQILQSDPLLKLIQKHNFVGWVYSIDYESASVLTNDLWKSRALGIPHNCFLVAASFDPEHYATASPADREVLLLRVLGSCKLPQDDDLVRTKIDHCQRQETHAVAGQKDYDDITRNQMQFGGLKCRVLGTFYIADGELALGSDLESFATASRLNVYRPRGDALRAIANHVDPLRRRSALEEARLLGLKGLIAPFQIGTVRYTSTDRLHRHESNERVPLCIQPSDFLARRTAVLGMTRTGKSNMVKQTISVVKRVADSGGVKIGQIIYDVNGEYANANAQDRGAIADVFPGETVRYRMIETPGFEELQNNFYIQLAEGFGLLKSVVAEKQRATEASDLGVFLNTSFDEPDPQEIGTHKRWQVRVAVYQALLFKAGFQPPTGHVIRFDANAAVQAAVQAAHSAGTLKDPKGGLTPDEAVDWFLAARTADRSTPLPSSTRGKPWLDEDTKAMLNMLALKNQNDTFIKGHKVLADARRYHSPRRRQEVGDEIYSHLKNGKIVIVDLSVGDPTLRDRISVQIAQDIFNKSMLTFIEGKTPPNLVVYIEEAHNLIGRKMELTETWPRLAKEGAKYRIGLVYATQEVSSVHPNILANTENWFISHLNNEDEIRALGKFYDFDDFSASLLRAQDVGFARVKTLSSPFVVPVQIDKFDPARVASTAVGTASTTSGTTTSSTSDSTGNAPRPGRPRTKRKLDGSGA